MFVNRAESQFGLYLRIDNQFSSHSFARRFISFRGSAAGTAACRSFFPHIGFERAYTVPSPTFQQQNTIFAPKFRCVLCRTREFLGIELFRKLAQIVAAIETA